ncbi:MAG: putative amidohydrolase [Gammaproteobacteria bacterium]|jgi:predicted amidohydrolase
MKILNGQIMAENIVDEASMRSHQNQIAEKVRQHCAEDQYDLILFPELSSIEYSHRAFENLDKMAQTEDGWLVGAMAELAKEVNTSICFGMPRVNSHGTYITQLVIDPKGQTLASYDKVHIAQFGASAEKPYFDRGNHVATFEIAGFRFGIIICYDMRFGEYIGEMVRRNELDVILHPVAFYQDGSFASWRSFVCTRALENQVYFISLNRAGSGWGYSRFCPPWFENENEVIELNEDEVFYCYKLDRTLLRNADASYPLKRDRIADYGDVLGKPFTVNH